MISDLVPRLVGAHEIRAMLGNPSRQRTYQITTRDDFPEPVAALGQGKVWREADVKAWIDLRPIRARNRGRKRGQTPAQAAPAPGSDN
jgi:prophage regulatory protein